MLTILTNFGAGFGPLVRTFDMARLIRQRLKPILDESINILIPWVYGENQLQILKEEIADSNEPDLFDQVLLSPELGDALRPLLFSGDGLNEELDRYFKIYEAQKKLWDHLFKSSLKTVDLLNRLGQVEPKSIRLEVTRNPVLATNIEYSYYSSVSYFSSIFEELHQKRNIASINYKLIEKAFISFRKMEAGYRLQFQPVPRCMSFKENLKPLFSTERETPPLIPQPKMVNGNLKNGIYISVSGISGLFSVYKEALRLPQTIYTNYLPDKNSKVQVCPPNYITHPAVNRVFARAAWNTIWLANISGTPLICPDHSPEDHPEIFYNLKSASKFKLAHVWNSKEISLEDFLSIVPCGKQKPPKVYLEIKNRFGTLDGLQFCVDNIVKDFLYAN